MNDNQANLFAWASCALMLLAVAAIVAGTDQGWTGLLGRLPMILVSLGVANAFLAFVMILSSRANGALLPAAAGMLLNGWLLWNGVSSDWNIDLGLGSARATTEAHRAAPSKAPAKSVEQDGSLLTEWFFTDARAGDGGARPGAGDEVFCSEGRVILPKHPTRRQIEFCKRDTGL